MTVHTARRTSTITTILCLVLSSGLLAQSQKEVVAPLPEPSGAFAIGTTVAYLTDTARRDPDLRDGRPITLQLWYPATSNGPLAPYLVEPALPASMLRNQYYGIDSSALIAWRSVRTHSKLDVSPTKGTHPLVAFSVGLGVARANYTSIAEELASHGYIVALVESPLQGYMVLPNGGEVMDTSGRFGTPAGHRRGVADWSKDISFALDALHAARVPEASRRVVGTIDWSRIGAAGHSSGGSVAMATCEADVRVRACVDLDGGVASPEKEPMADFVPRGTSKPTLMLRSEPLYDDTTFARRGTTREQWLKQREGGSAAAAEFVRRSNPSLRIAHLAGAGHFNFSDAPFVMPSAITRFGGRIIRPERGWTIITTVMRGYFDSEFAGHGDGLAALVARFPELTVDAPVR